MLNLADVTDSWFRVVQVGFEAKNGGLNSHMALDEVKISSGKCDGLFNISTRGMHSN